jgi:IS5 family transposase
MQRLIDTPREDDAKMRRNKDGSRTKKSNQSYLGYKLHSNVDTDLRHIRELGTITAAVHGSHIDRSQEGEVVYRDKGYYGAVSKDYAATMKRNARDYPSTSWIHCEIGDWVKSERLASGTTQCSNQSFTQRMFP